MTTPDHLSSAGEPPPAHLDPAYQVADATAASAPRRLDPAAAASGGAPASAGPSVAPDAPEAPETPAAPDADGRFGQGAGVDLAPVSQAMEKVRIAAGEGDLYLDEDMADDLLRSLAEIRDQVQRLEADASEVDVPLRFGNNWVGHAMSERLRGVADGAGNDQHSALKVIKQFRMVVDEYERAVVLAARRYRTTEHDLAGEMATAGEAVDGIGGDRT